MKRIIALAFLLLTGFYVAWPAWSGYQIHQAISGKNSALLESKIDFPRVRTSLKPVISAKISESVERLAGQAGPTGALILGQLKGDMLPKIVDSTLTGVVNSDNIMRIATEGGNVKESIEKIVREQIGKGGLPGGSDGGSGIKLPGGMGGGLGDLIGGLGLGTKAKPANPIRDVTNEPTSKPASAPAGDAKAPAKFSLANIKTFRLNGPLSYVVGVAKDPSAVEADVTAEMSFTGLDWKVTGIVPKL
jgi:Protein of unknown function (DUF2939)